MRQSAAAVPLRLGIAAIGRAGASQTGGRVGIRLATDSGRGLVPRSRRTTVRISTKALSRLQALATATVSAALLLGSAVAAAEDAAAPVNPAPAAGCVRGIDLMTPEERAQHMAQMRGLSAEEHAKFMEAHRVAMQARAAAKGQTLCSETMGQGMMGGGMGKGPHGPGGGPPPPSGGTAPSPSN